MLNIWVHSWNYECVVVSHAAIYFDVNKHEFLEIEIQMERGGGGAAWRDEII